MGCDIHAFTEVKKNEKWYVLREELIERNYDLFAKMADVRNLTKHIEPIAVLRGLPDDISDVVKWENESWGDDAHSHSWLTSDEVKTVLEWLPTLNGVHTFTERQLSYKLRHPTDYEYYDEVRLVFWFDN